MTLKEQLNSEKQKLFTTMLAAVRDFQHDTGILVKFIQYSDTSFAKFPDVHGAGFKVELDI